MILVVRWIDVDGFHVVLRRLEKGVGLGGAGFAEGKATPHVIPPKNTKEMSFEKRNVECRQTYA
jgi:hypothetical protein